MQKAMKVQLQEIGLDNKQNQNSALLYRHPGDLYKLILDNKTIKQEKKIKMKMDMIQMVEPLIKKESEVQKLRTEILICKMFIEAAKRH